MATSGSFSTSSYNSYPYPNKYTLTWSLASQNVGGNYSTINWNIYGDGGAGGGYYQVHYGTRVYLNGGLLAQREDTLNLTQGYVLFSSSFNVGHDGAGNASFSMSANGDLYTAAQSISGSGGPWALPRIPKPPTISSNSISAYAPTSVTAGGNVTDEGGASVTTRGVCYVAGTGTPTTANSKVASGSGGGSFSVSLTGLTPNTTYTARAYATNSQGTSYGVNRQFTTYELPAVTTDSMSAITGTTATVGGNMTNNGNPDVTERGFVYSTSPTPTTANTKAIVSGTATGAYSANLTGLTPSTTYYIRAYAINSAGTVYGNTLSFQTVVVPTLTTSAPAGVTTTSADMTGEVLSNGGGTVSERGFVYGTSPNPTTANSKLQVGSGVGVFSDTLTGLTPSVTYYVRSYAINEGGTGYGNQQSFTTVETNPLQPSNLDPTGGEATDDLTPLLSWQYNPGSANDTQSAYEIEVIRQSDSVVMWTTGKVTSTSLSVVYAGTGLAYNVNYQWRVRTWNQADLISPYSSLSLFKTSQLPVVSITYPTDGSTIPSNTPTVTWSYTDSEATTQVSYRVRIYAVDGVTLLHDSGEVLSAATSYLIPSDILESYTSYNVSLQVKDGDGLYSAIDLHDFTVEFLAPAQPTISTTVDAAGIVDVNVQLQQAPLDGWFSDQISLFKRKNGELERTRYLTSYDLNYLIVDDAEDEALWLEFGVARNPVAGTAKYGTQSVGFGVTGTGANSVYKLVTINNMNDYDVFQAMINVADNTDYTSLEFRLETDASNYYQIIIPSGDLANGVWNPIYVTSDDWTIVGVPEPTDITAIKFIINDATGSIPTTDILIDQIRLLQSQYTFKDYETANGEDLYYGVSAYSLEALVSTGIVESGLTEVRFTEERYNTYLVPNGQEEKMVRGWIDGSTRIPISDITDTQYYEPIGAEKPIVFVNAAQKYKKGSIELWFFDSKFDGQGLTSVEVLESIKNVKPILLRGWWGRNYWISVNGQLDIERKPGIGWSVSFSFTEISHE